MFIIHFIEGSLLMCYPSENLKKLVPKTLLSVVAVRQSDDVRDDSTNAEKLESDHDKSSSTKFLLFS